MKSLNQLIVEFEILKESKKSECFDKFEKVVFGDDRRGTRSSWGNGLERNTEEEERIYQAFIDWTEDIGSTDKIVSKFKELDQCKQFYKDELKPPKAPVYRGISISEQSLQKIIKGGLQSASKSIIKFRPENWRMGSYTYKAHQKMQSWSTSFSTATGFAGGGLSAGIDNEGKIPVVLSTKATVRDFLFSKFFMDKLGDYTEHEIVRLNKKPLMCDVYLNKWEIERKFGK
jgi:hypothetical protein